MMSPWYYDDPMDENGNYHYGYFEEYFTDPKRRAFLLYSNDALVGFAMLNPYSSIGHTPDYTMAEFTVFPAYRRRHIAREAANLVLSTYPGSWEIKYNEKNAAAKRFWTSLTAPFEPIAHPINEEETVLEFHT